MSFVEQWQLRARFARSLSDLYGEEVPAYKMLVEVAGEVNHDFQVKHPEIAERLGSLERVTAERHGAIRVGNLDELRQAARVFGAAGMHPVGFYDLRDASPAIPVVSTAFRPIDRDELAKNPFRVFTSMLVPEDRRFFDSSLEGELKRVLEQRVLFPDELLTLSDRAIEQRGLKGQDADRYLTLATRAFELSTEPVNRHWYQRLEAISSVAADIGGVSSTHINHLTPRVLDIDDLYRRMEARGITMIDTIQGPPAWDGPDILLRQTSFRALAEPRKFLEADGTVTHGDLKVRFGEVEARGVALTEEGRNDYDRMLGVVDQRVRNTNRSRADVLKEVWYEQCPAGEAELIRRDYAYFTFSATGKQVSDRMPLDLEGLLEGGWLDAQPIVYEDFLPRSAAGIFASNLSSEGSVDEGKNGTGRDFAWMAANIGVRMYNPYELYAAERHESFQEALAVLGLETDDVTTPWHQRPPLGRRAMPQGAVRGA